jgi:hypothetical protein
MLPPALFATFEPSLGPATKERPGAQFLLEFLTPNRKKFQEFTIFIGL